MKATSSTYKQIIESGQSRNFLVLIYMTLADNTQLTLTEEEIWMDSFSLETASSGKNTFDIGCAVIGACKFRIKNFNDEYTQYDFFNATATVWLKLEGDTQYYRMGFFTVEDPKDMGALISLEMLDNMWKFDTPFDDVGITFPITAGSAVAAVCSYCGVSLATAQFNGYGTTLAAKPEKEMNCREFIQYVAMLGCNFCIITDSGALALRWYNPIPDIYHFGYVGDYVGTYVNSANGEGYPTNIDTFLSNFSVTTGKSPITITGVKFTIEDTDYLIGNAGYVLSLENPFVTTDNVNTILNQIWDRLQNFTFSTFNLSTLSDLAIEVGDSCAMRDEKGLIVYSVITNNSFAFASHNISTGAVSPTRNLTKRYSKTVQAAVEIAREETIQRLTTYDLAVQAMNALAVNAIGAYQDYEELPTGGRVYYLSSAPLTKDASGHISLTSGSVVFKTTGDGFFVSQSGGTDPSQRTWINGYNMQTGELIVNLIYTIGLHADWIYTGEMTVGGSNQRTTNPTLVVKDSSNNTICTINSNGIIMGKGYIASSDYSYTTGNTFSDAGMKIDVNDKYIRTPHLTIDMNNGIAMDKGTIKSSNYNYESGHFSTDGMMIDLINRFIRSKYFAVDDSGAYFNGEVQASSGRIGAASIDQTSLTIMGDIEIGTGRFRPADYYFVSNFPLLLKTDSGTSTVTVTLHQNGSDTTIGTYTATTEGVTTAYLDKSIGGDDYYTITASSSCHVYAKQVVMASMGLGGFKGLLEGMFKGYIETSSGIINGVKMGSSEGHFITPDGVDLDVDDIAIKTEVAAKENFIGQDLVAPSSTYSEDGDLCFVGSIQSSQKDLYRLEDNGTTKVWTKVDLVSSHFTISTTDLGEGQPLAQGQFYLVVEP